MIGVDKIKLSINNQAHEVSLDGGEWYWSDGSLVSGIPHNVSLKKYGMLNVLLLMKLSQATTSFLKMNIDLPQFNCINQHPCI